MKETGLLLGIFRHEESAVRALTALRRGGIRRAVLLHLDEKRNLRIRHAGAQWRLSRQLRRKYSRWLVSGESFVLVQDRYSILARALVELRGGESPPAIFAFHPERSIHFDCDGDPAQPLNARQFQQYARTLASTHKLGPSPGGRPLLLSRLKICERILRQVRRGLEEASLLEQSISPSAEWILDNAYIVQGQISDVRLNLPEEFYTELPVLSGENGQGFPRVYRLAQEMIRHTDGWLDRHNISDFLTAYQSVSTLTIGELWALPMMLRIALVEKLCRLTQEVDRRLVEREQADFWANRLLAASRFDPNRLLDILAELAREHPQPGTNFAAQLTGHLFDEEAALVPVQNWIERKLKIDLGEIMIQEQGRQAADQASIGNAITSLRQMTLLDWRDIFEQQSWVEKILRKDPSGHFPHMDFNTRDSYRNAVEEIAKASGASEEDVARAAVDLAEQRRLEVEVEARLRHVGHYLVGRGRKLLADRFGGHDRRRLRVLRWITDHHSLLYLGTIGLVGAALLAIPLAAGLASGVSAWWLALIIILGAVPASQVTLQLINYMVSRLLPPRTLPKMNFEAKGIPDEFRTLVVVPVLWVNPDVIAAELDKLEIRYLANPDANLLYGLFGDFTDADQAEAPGDDALLQVAIGGIERLAKRYGDRFFLFHRGREWAPSEDKFIAWERKRGKLEELNRFLCGEPTREKDGILRFGEAQRLTDIRFVITLDADTELPRDAARHLVEALSHPLNRPWMSEDGRRVLDGYTIIQPRVSTALPSAVSTFFSRLFNDPVGTDPYTRAVSDVYQDLTAEGSYHGKGIYDVSAFHRVLTGRFPEKTLLSHDLIEGAHVRVGLATDIELYDDFPPDYLSHANRQHRWIRGDWQINDWCGPSVPAPEGGRQANPLSALNRWKIFDNLRRSLVPVTAPVFLLAAWLAGPAPGAAASALVGLGLLFPVLVRLTNWITHPREWKRFSWRELGFDLARTLADTSLFLHQGWLALDAVTRVFHRRLVSHRRLLEWTTAQVAAWKSTDNLSPFLVVVSFTSLAALLAGLAVWLLRPASLPAAAPFLILWFISPAVGWRMNFKPVLKARKTWVVPGDLRMLRRVSRRTWRYFDDFVGESSNWLPPDNFQVSYGNGLAMRTSPTNIGLWTLSAIGAWDFGYIFTDDAVGRLEKTFATLKRLDRFEGHLLNWYELEKLQPLEPRYISTVDSGNLLASLWALGSGLEEMTEERLLTGSVFRGLRTSLDVLTESLDRRSLSVGQHQTLESLSRLFGKPPRPALGRIQLLRRAEVEAADLEFPPDAGRGEPGEVSYWCDQFRKQLREAIEHIERYLPWMELIEELPREQLYPLGEEALFSRERALFQAPGLADLAAGKVPSLTSLLEARGTDSALDPKLASWLDRVAASFAGARAHAADTLERIRRLQEASRELASGMNMKFLYDRDRRLFSIGFNLNEGRLDSSFYDLLASEARLASFVAVARGDVPAEHWMAMGRPHGSVNRRRVLLSWGGTMFEYLMPVILQRVYENSLLDKACREAVRLQIDYGRRRGLPWGISESAYSDLDAKKVYQYKAFGAPGLGLKRGLEDDLVVAPYASVMALAVEPQAAAKNMHRLQAHGLYGSHGFFEAVDFGRQRRAGQKGVIVHAYMAHHQAMSFLTLVNYICGKAMQRRFHADPRVLATEPLLYERIPSSPPIYKISEREWEVSHAGPVEEVPSASRFETPHTSAPKTQLLSNGRLSLMVTAAGGGYTRWHEIDLTRWRSDSTRDAHGSFVYFRDMLSDREWSTGYQPLCVEPDRYSATFAADRAHFRRSDGSIDTDCEIIVAPEDDVEIRHFTLSNNSGKTREIELTSYLELALAPHGEDRAHPAFSKLFVETEAVDQPEALIARRQPRDPESPEVWAGQILVGEENLPLGAEFETDRRAFIGRGRDLSTPRALRQPLEGGTGRVLDPIFSQRRRFILEPHQRARFSLVFGAASSREGILALMEKYSETQAIQRQLDLAWRHAQLELRHLRIHPDEARRFQWLASHILYPGSQLRTPGERLQQNRLGQSRLWAHGISGDLPIVALSIGQVREISLVRQILQAHNYWRRLGLKIDLIILNEETTGYEKPLHEQLARLIQAQSMYTGVDEPGGVFLRKVDQIPEEDLTLMLAAARVSLVAARGPLAQQLSLSGTESPLPEEIQTRKVEEEPSLELPYQELILGNGIGGFTPDGREYVINLDDGQQTPAPWINVLANPRFGTLASESGSGFTWYDNSQQNRLTGWSNDPVSDPPSEAIYLRDEESGQSWSPTPLPIREAGSYRIRHGAGYSLWEHNSHGIEQELLAFVPVDEEGGQPLRIQRLRLRNDSSRRRTLSVYFYAEWTLGENREESQQHVLTHWDAKIGAMLARNHFLPVHGDRVAFATLWPRPEAFTADRCEFIGRNGQLSKPAALGRVSLAGRAGAALDPCAALQLRVELGPGDSREIICLLGQGENIEETHALITRFRNAEEVEKAYKQTRDWWDGLLGSLQVDTPDPTANVLINRWLPYQALSCRIWARSALYQSGGAVGFRDQLQDVMALLHCAPQLAREHILNAAGRQFREGDVQHWWHPQTGAGIRSRCSDDLLWLPRTVARYVTITGDRQILQEEVPFLDGHALEEHEHEVYGIPTETIETSSLYEHCRLAIERGLKTGPHGLPLIGTGDWNDGMNRVGIGGKGESIWLAWFLVDLLQQFAGLAEDMDDGDRAESWRGKAEELAATVEAKAWDGDWYRRAYFDDGTPLGSRSNPEAQIDSLAQSWAVLCGAADPDRSRLAMASALDRLVLEHEKLVLLFTPPFSQWEMNPGYIRSYPPGVRENGGQYTHAAVWLALALARQGDGEGAVRLLNLLNPIRHALDREGAERYRVEPYVVAADVYRLEGRVGMGGWSWYTGAASWMYRAWVEGVLGIERRGDSLELRPVLPNAWRHFELSYRYGKAIYEIRVENPEGAGPGVEMLELDGKRLDPPRIRLEDRAVKHRVLLRMGRRKPVAEPQI